MARPIAQLDDLVEHFGDAPLMARRRMQPALHANVALGLAGWKRPLTDHRAQSRPLGSEIRRVQVDGAVG